MEFGCPICQTEFSSNFAKPGRFTFNCPKCRKSFFVHIQVIAAVDPLRNPPTPRRPAVQPKRVEQHDFEMTLPSEMNPAPHSFTSKTSHAPKAAPGNSGIRMPKINRLTDDDDEAGGMDLDGTIATPVNLGQRKHPATPPDPSMPAKLGGYEILEQLGKGGMGAVYLARQMSLDRSVALKVMNGQLASDPVFIARFVREAYAAAQLSHHNIIQIYDIGLESEINFFSMEFVQGRSLGDLLKSSGKVPPREAIGYIVQAAYGLKFAHDRGMVHRDIKPDNLMLNGEGIVKVADLGLVKTGGMTAEDDAPGAFGERSKPGSMLRQLPNVTNVGTAMGSPSYMAPEQCRDASTVDHRADVYSLGCSLYAMLSGRAPFSGATAVEVISKHLNELPQPLHKVMPTAPRGLSPILEKSLMKLPEHRYQSMEEFIGALKGWQEWEGQGLSKPTEEHLSAFEERLAQFADNSSAKLARQIPWFVPAIGVVAALAAVGFSVILAGGIVVGTLATLGGMFLAGGILGKSALFAKVREWAFGARILDWLMVLLGTVALLAVLYFAGLLAGGLIAIVLGAGLGATYGFLVAKPAAEHRAHSKEEFEKILKRLRMAGLDEDSVRGFVIDASSDRWESVYELIFGYPAKLAARRQFAEKVAARPQIEAWRDGWIAKIDAVIERRKQARAGRLLRKKELARLKAEGVSPAEARAFADQAALEILEQAVEIKAANLDTGKKVNVRGMLAAQDRRGRERRKPKPPLVRLANGAMDLLFDARLRFLLGSALLVLGLMWFKSGVRIESAPVEPTEDGAAQVEVTEKLSKSVLTMITTPEKYGSLSYNWLPPEVAGYFVGANAVVAGLLLFVSLFSSKRSTTFYTMLAAAIAFAGHRFGLPIPTVAIPNADALQPSHLTALAGIVLAGLALLLFGRRSG